MFEVFTGLGQLSFLVLKLLLKLLNGLLTFRYLMPKMLFGRGKRRCQVLDLPLKLITVFLQLFFRLLTFRDLLLKLSLMLSCLLLGLLTFEKVLLKLLIYRG